MKYDITEIDITESAITNFQKSDITEKENCYNGILYNKKKETAVTRHNRSLVRLG